MKGNSNRQVNATKLNNFIVQAQVSHNLQAHSRRTFSFIAVSLILSGCGEWTLAFHLILPSLLCFVPGSIFLILAFVSAVFSCNCTSPTRSISLLPNSLSKSRKFRNDKLLALAALGFLLCAVAAVIYCKGDSSVRYILAISGCYSLLLGLFTLKAVLRGDLDSLVQRRVLLSSLDFSRVDIVGMNNEELERLIEEAVSDLEFEKAEMISRVLLQKIESED